MANITIPNFTTGEKVVNGLNDYSYTIQTTATHNVSCNVTQPNPTGMTVTIKNNASTIATFTLPANSIQGNFLCQTPIACAANDVVHIVLASSNSNDQQLNNVVAKLNIHIAGLNG